MYCILITYVTAVIDDDELTASNFDVKVFLHHQRLPAVCINPECEFLDVFLDANLSRFGEKGKHGSIQFCELNIHTCVMHISL